MSRDEIKSITLRRGVEFCEWFLLGRIVRDSIGEPDGGQSVTVQVNRMRVVSLFVRSCASNPPAVRMATAI